MKWGNRREESRLLPTTCWTTLDRVELGWWQQTGAEQVQVPCGWAWVKGIWFPVPEAIRGLMLPDETEHLRAYLVVQSACYSYQIMTCSDWQSVLTRQI